MAAVSTSRTSCSGLTSQPGITSPSQGPPTERRSTNRGKPKLRAPDELNAYALLELSMMSAAL